jgi:hypothetical protein
MFDALPLDWTSSLTIDHSRPKLRRQSLTGAVLSPYDALSSASQSLTICGESERRTHKLRRMSQNELPPLSGLTPNTSTRKPPTVATEAETNTFCDRERLPLVSDCNRRIAGG